MKYIYVIENTETTQKYVGQTNNPKRRWEEHQRNSKKKNSPLYRSMRHWGLENFTFKIIEECEDQMADEREHHWMVEFDTLDGYGYNQVDVNETMKQRRKKKRQIS